MKTDNNNITILIVEDEAVTAQYLQKKISSLGYTVIGTVSSGKDAIDAFEKKEPDLVLMDIKIKGEMDGIETAEKINALRRVPVIYITAFIDDEILQRAKITEPYGYLLKPVNERELHVLIEIALYKDKMSRELEKHQQHLEELIEERTSELQRTVETLNREIKERKSVEEKLIKQDEELRTRNDIIEKDLRSAQLIQRAMLPGTIPEYENLKIDFRYLPLKAVGGDYFSFTLLSEGGMGVLIGDVESHGVTAALFISLVKFATNRVCRQFGQKPAQYMSQLNKDLRGHLGSSFMTALYAFLKYHENSRSLDVSFASGGHPYPVIQRKDSGEIKIIEHSGPLLGYFEDVTFEERTFTLNEGDRLYLFTDGLIEVLNPDKKMLGYNGLISTIKESSRNGLPETLDRILESINSFCGDTPMNDDTVIIGFECG